MITPRDLDAADDARIAVTPTVRCQCGFTVTDHLPQDSAQLLKLHRCPKPADRVGSVVLAVIVALVCATIVALKIVT
jgi:hypothetical protein